MLMLARREVYRAHSACMAALDRGVDAHVVGALLRECEPHVDDRRRCASRVALVDAHHTQAQERTRKRRRRTIARSSGAASTPLDIDDDCLDVVSAHLCITDLRAFACVSRALARCVRAARTIHVPCAMGLRDAQAIARRNEEATLVFEPLGRGGDPCVVRLRDLWRRRDLAPRGVVRLSPDMDGRVALLIGAIWAHHAVDVHVASEAVSLSKMRTHPWPRMPTSDVAALVCVGALVENDALCGVVARSCPWRQRVSVVAALREAGASVLA